MLFVDNSGNDHQGVALYGTCKIVLAGLIVVFLWLTPGCFPPEQYSDTDTVAIQIEHSVATTPCSLPENNAGSADSTAILPPALPWHGRSEELIVARNDPWISPAQASDFQTTPRYPQKMEWLCRLTDASPLLEMISIGKSPEGRDIPRVSLLHE